MKNTNTFSSLPTYGEIEKGLCVIVLDLPREIKKKIKRRVKKPLNNRKK